MQVIFTKGTQIRVENVESAPQLINAGCRAFAIVVDDGVPCIGDEITLGEAETVAKIIKQPVMLNGEVIGEGQYKA